MTARWIEFCDAAMVAPDTTRTAGDLAERYTRKTGRPIGAAAVEALRRWQRSDGHDASIEVEIFRAGGPISQRPYGWSCSCGAHRRGYKTGSTAEEAAVRHNFAPGIRRHIRGNRFATIDGDIMSAELLR